MILDSRKYIEKEQSNWHRLEEYCKTIESDPSFQLSLSDLQTFNKLYRRAISSLACLQESYAPKNYIDYMENLIGRSYSIIYSHHGNKKKISLSRWFFQDFPKVFRNHLWAFALSCLITGLGASFGSFIMIKMPQLKTEILPFGNGQIDPVKRVAEEESGMNRNLDDQKSTFSAYLIQNNISVSVKAIALGITFGIGTLFLLFYNGIMLGAICLDYYIFDKGIFLAGWLLPHGSIEIPAILLAGQTGFIIAGALIGRGGNTLTSRFKKIGPDIVILLGGIAVMLIWAGIIEAFFSQYHYPILPYWVKIAFGLIELSVLTAFLALGGKHAKIRR
jgi:uncharacterized membrane protein SpoIIM required for sporulation